MALGNVHQKLGNFKTAIDCYQRRLKFAIELGERIGEAAANSNLGSASSTLGDFKTAINYHKRHLEISQELGDRSGESAAYGNLGNAYLHLGAFETAIDYHDRHRKISKQLCDTGRGNSMFKSWKLLCGFRPRSSRNWILSALYYFL